jgi:hypothetical protein
MRKGISVPRSGNDKQPASLSDTQKSDKKHRGRGASSSEPSQPAVRTDDPEPASRETQHILGQLLRVHFSELTEDPVPDRLLRLLADLEQRERTQAQAETTPEPAKPPAVDC